LISLSTKKKQNTQSLNQNNSINTSSLQSGVYFYQHTDSKGKVLGAGKWVKAGE